MRRVLTDLLERMVRRGQLVEIEPDRYALPQAIQAKQSRNALVGRLKMHGDGFGFVIPDAISIPQHLKGRLTGDVFIPPHAVGTAMHGDRVLVEVGSVRDDGKAEGVIVRTVMRAHPTVVGTFHYGQRHNYVVPMDGKLAQEIMIPNGMERPKSVSKDGGAGEDLSAHRVLGAEARRAQTWDDLEGLVVDVEITEWPTTSRGARGRVVEILGREDDFGVDVEIIIRKHHLPRIFPEAVLAEARAVPSQIADDEVSGRRDFRDLSIVTIDGETARDFDDAVTVTELANGNFELQVHIADVAQYVTEESPLDAEARLRGTSVYFPDRAIPMLPLELSTDICSLRPHVDRLVLSCVMEFDRRGELVRYELCEGVIRSAQRMTYTNVNRVLQADPNALLEFAPLVDLFHRMRDLATLLNKKRERRGSIDFDLPEAVIEFDEFGLMSGVSRSERNIAHRIIEEFMLSANECVADYLEGKGVGSLYRIHEKPDAKRVYDFEVVAATWGYSLGVGSLPIERMHLKSDRRASRGTGKRAAPIELPKEVHLTPRMYQKLTKKIAGTPEERILSFLMLRSLKQARYSEENSGHFALAAPCYTHFTSPIRRYPDLIVHRILKQVLRDDAEQEHEENGSVVPVGIGPIVRDGSGTSPWGKHSVRNGALTGTTLGANPEKKLRKALGGPISVEELNSIATESSQSERRADDAERELMGWKKVKFMEQRVGDEFDGLIISITKNGLFVELTDLFIEGLVPISLLTSDHFLFHEGTRQIVGKTSRITYSLGDRVRVLVDRIDPVEKKVQFALVEEEERQRAERERGQKRRKRR